MREDQGFSIWLLTNVPNIIPSDSRTLDHNQKKTFFRKRYPRKAGNQDKDGRALYAKYFDVPKSNI